MTDKERIELKNALARESWDRGYAACDSVQQRMIDKRIIDREMFLSRKAKAELDICPRCKLSKEVGDHKLLDSCIRALRGALIAEQRKFEDHTTAVADFLNELWAIMVDPLAEGTRTVAETMEGLRKAALLDREAQHAADRMRDQLERASQYVRMHCGDSKSAERLFDEIVSTSLKED